FAYVDCVLPAQGLATVSVQTLAPVASVPPPVTDLALALGPSPLRAGQATLTVRWSAPAGERMTIDVLDLQGRAIATMGGGPAPAGPQEARWSPGAGIGPGLYYVRLRTPARTRFARLVIVR